jgi:23S rRNA (uracil1939-C5)-methyltransferase
MMDFETVRITDMDASGRGVGRTSGGLAVFVPGLIPGDVASVTLTQMKKRFATGAARRLIEPSPDRVVPACPYAGRCGGCSLQAMRYSAQTAMKERQVRDRLIRIGGVREPLVRPIAAMEVPWRCRNKARYTADAARVGFFAAESRDAVDVTDCPIQAPPANAAAGALRRFLADSRRTEDGLIRGLTVRTAFGTGEVMVLLSVSEKKLIHDDAERLILMMDDAVSALPEAENGTAYSLESVVFCTDDEKIATVAGRGVIAEEAGGLLFEISPLSFFQVNPVQTRALEACITRYAALSGAETVFDLYCGVGGLGLRCAKEARRVVGIETSKSAVLDANRNATLNGAVNAEFICGRAERALPELLTRETPHVVILDPPRAGCRAELLSAVASAAPARVVYVSCDPATLARDVKLLTACGYDFAEATPIDMFPHTASAETVALLRRRDT